MRKPFDEFIVDLGEFVSEFEVDFCFIHEWVSSNVGGHGENAFFVSLNLNDEGVLRVKGRREKVFLSGKIKHWGDEFDPGKEKQVGGNFSLVGIERTRKPIGSRVLNNAISYLVVDVVEIRMQDARSK